MKHIANALTVFRMICALALLLCAPLSPAFTALYLSAGMSDMLDGPAARLTGSVSERGARLDSVADLLLVTVCAVRLLPVFTLPRWVYVWTAAIAFVKLRSLAFAARLRLRPEALHSLPNRLTGALLFLFPLTLPFLEPRLGAGAVCAFASLSALHECCVAERERNR